MRRSYLEELIKVVMLLKNPKIATVDKMKWLSRQSELRARCDHKWSGGHSALHNEPLSQVDQVDCIICKKIWIPKGDD